MAALWLDKHRPTSFDQLTFHPQVNECLKKLAASEDVPHLLLSGPPGGGKMTRIRSFLSELFDSSIYRLKLDDKVFQTPSSKRIELTVFASNHHVEMNPSDVGIYDRVVIQEIIKEVAQTQQLDRTKHAFKVAVILEADRMSKDAQHALRRTMEKYSSNLRLILCCTSSSRIIAPIKSRCFMIRVPSPTSDEIRTGIRVISKAEGVRVGDDLMNSVVSTCSGNNRRAILSLETAIARNESHAGRPEWEQVIELISEQIMREQSPASLLIVRGRLYELLTHAIPAVIVIKTLVFSLIARLAPKTAREMIDAAAFYENRLSKGSKPILHLEAFVAKTMSSIASHAK